MYRYLLVIFLSLLGSKALAQDLIPFDFTSEDENHLIRENDSLKYFTATSDTALTVVLNEEATYYKLLNKERKLIAEGSYIAEGDKYLQEGKWVSKFDNGKLKMTGYFRRNLPIGTWTEYYNTGKVKTVSNYGVVVYKGETNTCLSGSYQEYYPSGKLKVSGFYSTALATYKDTIVVEDPVTNNKISKVITKSELKSDKIGRWEYYTEAGELDKKEDF